MKLFIKNQFTFLLLGFVFWFPILILILILIFLFNNIEDVGRIFLLFFLPEKYFHPGFGIVFSLVLVYLTGIALKLTKIKRIFSKVPILGLFFGGGEIVTIERLLHLRPCLFLMSPSCISYGWILSEEKVKIKGEKATFTLINVYYPNVPSLITGQVFPVRKSTVIRLGNPSKEIIDLLLYSFRSPKDLIYLPWEDESNEEFEKRAKSYGINLF
ncbi:MAG: hypothetical protein JSV32_00020 [Dehalococcoidia bacterium]|nr:MAG: hypothetical protein JSV32_00020 [Dehalococcoidia bacterium]